MLNQIALNRLHVLTVADAEVTVVAKFTFLAELAELGFRVVNPDCYNDSLLHEHEGLIDALKALRGGDVDYVPLYQNFPTQIPELGEEWMKRLCGSFLRSFGPIDPSGRLMSGDELPSWLFDLEEYGADPVSQIQREDLFRRGVARQQSRSSDSHTEWIDLRIVTEEEREVLARTFLLENLYAKSSIKEALWPDLLCLLDHFGAGCIEISQVARKETLAQLMKYHWTREEYSEVAALNRSATDVLRLVALLTDSDVTLATTVKFPRLTRRQRREVLGMLAVCQHLEEDLVAYRGLWKAFAKGLHPCEAANRRKFPLVADAFFLLRSGALTSFLAEVENAISAGNQPLALSLLSQRPGLFLRKLHQLLELAGAECFQQVLDAFEKVHEELPLKNLLVLQSYFSTIEEQEVRTVVLKNGSVKTLANRPGRLVPDALKEVQRLLNRVIVKKVRFEKEAWIGKKVWVDPRLRFYTVPLQQRHMSDGVLSIGRGTTLPIEEGNVLRLFMYWKDADTDLDLSVIRYDAAMNYRGDVSYQNTSAPGLLHSGDIQRAPLGAAEFVDVDLAHIREHDPETRFLTAQVYRWTGPQFEEIDARTGWMLRENVDSDFKSFDLKAVVNAVQLHGTKSYCISLLVDLKKMTVTFIDLYVKGVDHGNRAKESSESVAALTQGIAGMLRSRPNMYRLAAYHLVGRGAAHVEEAEDADIRIGVDEGCDYRVGDVQTILTEFL